MKRRSFLFFFFLLSGLILSTCTASQTRSEPDLFTVAVASAGAHISLADEPPPGFLNQPLAQVFAQHQAGVAVWLHAPEIVLKEMADGNEFRSWLQAVRALHFPNSGQDLYWIPPSFDTDSLAFAEQMQIASRIEPEQQATLWKKRGNAQRSAGNFREAITSYQKALALGAEDVEVYAGLGAAYLGIGKNEQAAAELGRAVVLAPDDYWAHRLLGNAYLKLQRYNLALDELTQAYIIRPDDSHLLLGIALAQGRAGHIQDALRTLQQLQSLTENPNDRADADKLRQEFLATQSSP